MHSTSSTIPSFTGIIILLTKSTSLPSSLDTLAFMRYCNCCTSPNEFPDCVQSLCHLSKQPQVEQLFFPEIFSLFGNEVELDESKVHRRLTIEVYVDSSVFVNIMVGLGFAKIVVTLTSYRERILYNIYCTYST